MNINALLSNLFHIPPSQSVIPLIRIHFRLTVIKETQVQFI